jgi:hypothetical protein
MPKSPTDLIVVGDRERARATIVDALQRESFRITWTDTWRATASRGSRAANFFVGVFAQHFKITVDIMTTNDGATAIRLTQAGSGWMGGVPGIIRARRNYSRVVTDLAGSFAAAGVLVADGSEVVQGV